MLRDFDFQPNDFTWNSKKAIDYIEKILINYLDTINVKTIDQMNLFFALLELDSNTICGCKMENVGAWRCEDCVNTENTIFCQECWSKTKEKHANHNIVFLNRVNGTCDCGDHNCIDKKYFCPKHIGIFENDAEINDYILDCLGEKVSGALKLANDILFRGMAKYYILAVTEKQTKSQGFIKAIESFVSCFGVLCKMSTACSLFVGDLMLKKYPFKTKHTCLEVIDNGGKIVKAPFFGHDCCCHFIRFIIEFWPGKISKAILYKLITNYKVKTMLGLHYFFFYGDFFKNCMSDFQDISVQIIFNDVLRIACKIDGLIDRVYESMIELFEIFLDEDLQFKLNDCLLSQTLSLLKTKRFELMKELVYKLRVDTIYIIKKPTLNYLSNNTNIIFKLIDLTAMLQNVNVVKVIKPRPIYNKGSKYKVEILDVELWLLDVFALFISIFNFDDVDLVKEVFTYFSKVILKKNKKALKDDEYSFHIPIYRAFSIFLNRYCFFEANKNNTNILKSLQSAITLMPDFKNCSKIMIKSIYKVFGFVTGCEEGFFNYYGETMGRYEYLYYYNPEFIYRDFCLLKYLLSIKENADYISFNKVLEYCQVEDSHKPIEDYILKIGKVDVLDPQKLENNKPYLKFSSKILFLILSLLRNNTSIFWNLCSAYKMMRKNKLRDKLIIDLMKKDINNFHELTKELVINQILIKENLASFTEISDSIFLSLKDFFGEKNVTDIIMSLTNKTLTKDKKAKFSLKDELLYYLDLNYIIYPIYKSAAEKYITDFKSKQVSIFNVHFYPDNKFEAKLTEENYNNLYFNEKNFDFLFQFTSLILTKKPYEILNEFFLSVILNYLSTFLCYNSEHFMFLRENIKTEHIVKVLENNNLTDEVKKSYCKFIVQKFKQIGCKEVDKINEINENKDTKKNEINVEPVKKNPKMTMKEKMKNKFKKKNDNLSNKLGVDKIQVDDKKGKESCIYCLKPIETDDISKPYGTIGDFLNDNYTSNAFFQVIRKEYKKHYDKDLKLKEFDSIYYQPLDRKSIRIISCNHLIHFPCFFKQFMESDLLNSLSIFVCPLCNRLSETCIPMLTQYTEEQTFGFLKGFDFKFVIDFCKNNEQASQNALKNIIEGMPTINDDLNEEKKDDASDKVEEKKDDDDTPKKIVNKEAEEFRNKYPDFVNLCKHFIEGFVGMRAAVKGLDLEAPLIKPSISKFSTAFGIQYRDFITYLDNIDDKKNSISLWKNFILSMKLMNRLDIIEKEKYFLRFYKMIKEIRTLEFDISIDALIQLDNIKLRTCEILLLFSILFEYNNVEGYEKYILYMVLPIYAFGFFFRTIYYKTSFFFSKNEFLEHLKSEELYKFLEEDTSFDSILIQVGKELLFTKIIMNKDIDINNISLELNNILDELNLSNLKGKTLLQCLDELDKLIEADASDEKMKIIYENLKPENNYKDAFEKILTTHINAAEENKCDEILSPSLFGSCLPLKFSFIELPELAVDFEYEIYMKECIYCKGRGQRSLICLDCGKKVCDSRSCLTTYNEEEVPGFIAHTKICGGGRSAFLQNDDCSVLFISNKAVFKKFVPLYLNEFGEGISKETFGKEFKLNKEEVKKALKMFTEYSYSNAEIIT